MSKSNYLYALAFATSILAVSCKPTDGGAGDSSNSTTADSSAASSKNMENNENPLSKNGITLTVSENDPAFNDAMIELNVPAESDKAAIGPVEFAFNVKNYVLGNQTSDAETKMCANSAKGQHIHLILNNNPYSAHYESQFNKELEEGHYVALAFLSRSYHMSVKQPDAYVLRQFTVGEAENKNVDLTAPHLFYSRPKGEYVGDDTKKVMLDFYLVNTEISPEGNKVRATINGNEFIIDQWAPYFVEGLPMGDNTFKIELIDKDGNAIEGPFNTEERTVKLSELN